MNSLMLQALVVRDGGLPRILGPLPDDRAGLEEALAGAAEGRRSRPRLGRKLHGTGGPCRRRARRDGVARCPRRRPSPASPTGLGFVAGVPVVLLPGNPVSCLCAYDLFAGRIVRRLGGRPAQWPYRSLELPLARKLTSALGRLDYSRVRLVDGAAIPLAIGGASILSSTTRADGFVLVPADLEGYPAGAIVRVWLYDR